MKKIFLSLMLAVIVLISTLPVTGINALADDTILDAENPQEDALVGEEDGWIRANTTTYSVGVGEDVVIPFKFGGYGIHQISISGDNPTVAPGGNWGSIDWKTGNGTVTIHTSKPGTTKIILLILDDYGNVIGTSTVQITVSWKGAFSFDRTNYSATVGESVKLTFKMYGNGISSIKISSTNSSATPNGYMDADWSNGTGYVIINTAKVGSSVITLYAVDSDGYTLAQTSATIYVFNKSASVGDTGSRSISGVLTPISAQYLSVGSTADTGKKTTEGSQQTILSTTKPDEENNGKSEDADNNKKDQEADKTTEDKTTEDKTAFTDVSPSAYYYNAVYWALEKGITSGLTATTFGPKSASTRGQMAVFLWKMAGSPSVSGSNPFKDVKSSSYYYKAVLWAVKNGITSGTTGTTFSPSAPCTRGQTAVFLWKMAGSPAVSGSNPFKDVKSGSYYYKAALWAVKNGITSGTTSTTFSPNATCTRGQTVTFLYKYAGGK